MGYGYFHPFGTKSIKITFQCAECGCKSTSNEEYIPSPNYYAEKASESHNSSETFIVCNGCGKDYDVEIFVGYGDAYVEIDGIDDENILRIDEIPEDDMEYYDEQIESILSSNAYYTIFLTEIENLLALSQIDIKHLNLQETLFRQIYSGTITCLEDYLSSTIVYLIFYNQDNFKNFVKTFPKIKERRFDLNEIYEQIDNLNSIVKKEILDIIYHDLPKVKNMYQDTLKIKFPEIKELMSMVQIRHDMVHRNGKNKDGKEYLTQEILETNINFVKEFVSEIEAQIQTS